MCVGLDYVSHRTVSLPFLGKGSAMAVCNGSLQFGCMIRYKLGLVIPYSHVTSLLKHISLLLGTVIVIFTIHCEADF